MRCCTHFRSRNSPRLRLVAKLLVQGCKRCVEQEYAGSLHQRARKGNPLALSAGELMWPAFLVAFEPHQRQYPRNPRGNFRPGKAILLESESNIVFHIEMRK